MGERRQLRKYDDEVEHERQQAHNQKLKRQAVLSRQIEDAHVKHANKSAEKKERHEWERFKVKEFEDMCDEQARRNKIVIPPNRGVDAPEQPSPARRGYSENEMLRQQEERLRNAEEAELQKQAHRRGLLGQHLQFLGEQIEARNRVRSAKERENMEQRSAVQATTEAYVELERARIEASRMKNILHRRELEEMIASRRDAPKDPLLKMSPHEKSINKGLIQEAKALRQRVGELIV